MMDTIRSTSGFNSEGSLSGRPHTPPYTPARKAKRRLERSVSPASTVASIRPTELDTPVKKIPKRCENADIKVEELLEGDLGYMTDIDVVYPEELEEISSSDSVIEPEEASDVSDSEASGLTRKLSRLRCGDDREVTFEQDRHQRHVQKRNEARKFKRTHSQSMKGEGGETNVALDDQDHNAGKRRLRRRTKGPETNNAVFGDTLHGSFERSTGRVLGHAVEYEVTESSSDDAMNVDNGQ